MTVQFAYNDSGNWETNFRYIPEGIERHPINQVITERYLIILTMKSTRNFIKFIRKQIPGAIGTRLYVYI